MGKTALANRKSDTAKTGHFARKSSARKRYIDDQQDNYSRKACHTNYTREDSKVSTCSLDSGFSDRYRYKLQAALPNLDSIVQEEVLLDSDACLNEPVDCPWLTEGFDLCIRVGNEVLPVHRSLLLAESDIMKTIIYSVNYSDEEAVVISLPNRDVRNLKELIKIIYDKKYMVTEENVVGLLSVADEFMVDNVLARCERFLLECDTFTSIELLDFAVQYKLEKLREEASLRVSMIPAIEYSSEFEAMGLEEQNLILRHLVQRQRRKLDLLEDIAADRCPYHQFTSNHAKCCFKVSY